MGRCEGIAEIESWAWGLTKEKRVTHRHPLSQVFGEIQQPRHRITSFLKRQLRRNREKKVKAACF
jgi:hypothetical protein